MAPPANLQALIDDDRLSGPIRGGALPPRLRARYDGELPLPLRSGRPSVVVNFVETLDGVTSYATADAAGGGEISGFFEPDRFVMGLLRSLADVVLIGASTLRSDKGGAWTAPAVHPESADDFAALRSQLGLSPNPVTAVLTASGEIDLSHPGLMDPDVEVLIITTEAGAAVLGEHRLPAHVEVLEVGERRVEPEAAIALLGRQGAQVVLCEGGSHLLAQLLRVQLVDELFLTIAPQLAGRSVDAPRLGLVEGTAFGVSDAPWARLASLRRAGDHLFTRYQF